VNNMCICPADRVMCGNTCCPTGQKCLPGPGGGMRCGIPPIVDPMPPGPLP
jgi:hypothetical protein